MAVIKIAKRGADSGGLIRYLFGKGKNNEHVNQRTIAGTTHAHSGVWDKASIHQIVTDLRSFSQANPQSRIGPENKHVWHAAVSLPPGETLTDAGWQKLAQDYMRGMGFDDPAKSPIRWTAVHHGLSREGNDHIHIVMSMIRQDGSKVRVHNDAQASRTVLTGIEQRLGLTVLKPAPAGARPITYKAGERGKAEKTGNPIEREDLARMVRAAATASKTEAEFVRRLRGSGLVVKPREGTGLQQGRITGYAVGFPNSIMFGGGKLARDLSLPRLRQAWGESPAAIEQAAAEWRLGKNGAPRVKYGRETRKNTPVPGDVKQELADAHFRLATATEAEFPAISADLAGALALTSAHDPRLTQLSTEVGRAAQTKGAPARRSGGSFLNLGLLVMAITDPDPRTREMLMIRQVVAMLVTLVQTHRARAAALTQERSTGMSQPDASDEATEMGVTLGVTLGAAAVQLALQKLHERGPDKPPDSPLDPAEPEVVAVEAPLVPPTPAELRDRIGNQLDALRIPPANLSNFGDAELFSLSERLDETIAQDPVAKNRMYLLDKIPTKEWVTDAGQQRRDWIMTASPMDLHAEVVAIELSPVLDAKAQAQQQQAAPAGQIPNWRTGGDPMTPAQRFTLKKYCAAHGMDPYKDLSIQMDDGTTVGFQQFTKAQASGAISEFGKLQAQAPAMSGVGVANSNPRSAVAQQVILSVPGYSNAPHIEPDNGKNVGRGNSRY